MVFSNSPYIFQQKIKNLLQGFESMRAYISNLLLIKKVDWTDHVQKPELTLKIKIKKA